MAFPTADGQLIAPVPAIDQPDPEAERLALEQQEQQEKLKVAQELRKKRLFDYQTAQDRMFKLISNWEQVLNKAEENRRMRNLEVDRESLRSEGHLGNDETIIGIRTIDENIRKEQPPYHSFMKQSRRLVTMKSKTNPNRDTQAVENYFADNNRYLHWEEPFFKSLDGGMTHGLDHVEIEVDVTKPLGITVTHTGFENLIYDTCTKNIYQNEEIFRRHEISIQRLREMVADFNFDAAVVDDILKDAEQKDREDHITIYKRFHKFEGTVFVSWIVAKEERNPVSNWLSAPRPLVLGDGEEETSVTTGPTVDPMTGAPTLGLVPTVTFKDKPETEYPFKTFFYQSTEDPKVLDHKGRCFFDKEKQEAQTALWSLTINGAIRASNVYASPKKESMNGMGRIEKLDLTLEPGCFYTEPVEFWSPPYPPAGLLQAANALDVKTQAERGDFAAAVINRQDARKTAKELETSESKEISLNSVQVGSFSNYVSDVYQDVWRLERAIIKRQGQPPVGITQEDLDDDYVIRAAGDIDVVKRNEKLEKRFTMWPIVATTPVAPIFLADMLQELFPEEATKYVGILQQAMMAQNQQAQLSDILLNVLTAAVTDDNGQLKPEFQQNAQELQQLGAMVQQQKQLPPPGQTPTQPPAKQPTTPTQ